MLHVSLALAAPGPVSWLNLNQIADQAFDAGPGRAHHAQIEASERAQRTVPLGPTHLRVEAQVGETTQQQLLAAVEVPLGLGIQVRRFYAATRDHRAADRENARWQWTQQVQQGWLDWWTAATIEHHLTAYAAEVDAELQSFAEAVDEGLLAPIALEDLRAESLQIRAEVAAMVETRTVAEAEIHGLIGDLPLDASFLPELPETNPWTPLVDHAAALPPVREAEARVRLAERRAGQLTGAWTPTLSIGPMWAPDAKGRMVPFAYAGVSLPLQPGARPERRLAKGEASAAEADLSWTIHSLRARLAGEQARWDAARARMERLETEVLAPLQARENRLEQALVEGLVTADRVVRARRESHEAEHEQVRIQGTLLASQSRAALITTLLENE